MPRMLAARAFSYATAGIRATFATPENFMEMVRTQYAVVYRPKHVAFEAPLVHQGDIVQPVRFTDGAGRLWLGLYPTRRSAIRTLLESLYGRLGRVHSALHIRHLGPARL